MASDQLVRIAEGASPRHASVLVSTVLGQHLPVGAARCRMAGFALGLLAAGDPRAADARRTLLEGSDAAALAMVDAIEISPAGDGEPWVVVGLADSARALGEQVASALDAAWWQMATREAAGAQHDLVPETEKPPAGPAWLDEPQGGWPGGTLVVVTGALTSGDEAAQLIASLHERQARTRYVVAALLDCRGPGDDAVEQLGRRLGVAIELVALERRRPQGAPVPGWSGGSVPELLAGVPRTNEIREVWLGWDGALAPRTGMDREARIAFADQAVAAAAETGPLPRGTLVISTGDQLALAQRAAVFAGALTCACDGTPLCVSSREEYPIRDGLAFAAASESGAAWFAYNVHASRRPAIVVHFQDAEHRERGQGLLDALVAAGARDVTAVTLAP